MHHNGAYESKWDLSAISGQTLESINNEKITSVTIIKLWDYEISWRKQKSVLLLRTIRYKQ